MKNNGKYLLKTKDYSLKYLTNEDFDEVFKIISDEESMKNFGPTMNQAQASSLFKKYALDDLPIIYGIDNGEKIIGLYIYRKYDENSIEIGWVLDSNYKFQGVLMEITQELLSVLEKNQIDCILKCKMSDTTSQAIASHFGFLYVATNKKTVIYRKRNS